MFRRPVSNLQSDRHALRSLLFAVALFALFVGGSTVGAQVIYGSLTGTVTDKSGAVVPNLTVAITNQGTAEVRTAQSNDRGDYAVRDLQPGDYTVSVKKMGSFAGYTQKNIAIDANRQVRVDITLQLGNVVAEVTVDTAPPMLQTETAEVNNEISEAQISELPISSSQGRNFQALYNIIPGATNVQEQNSGAGNPSRSMQANVNGMSYMSNATRIDGAINIYGWLPYLIAYVPPADAIDSVNMVTSSYNAEQGVAGGASINVTIKSGTRNLHGSAWEYYQDAAFNARSYTATQASLVSATNPSGSVPKNVFDQFGFAVGGPVYIPKILTGRKKLFFFEDFERTTRRQLITGTQTVPDSKMASGDFSEVATGAGAASTILYDPQPGGTGPFLPVGSRPTFLSEYGSNAIPAARQSAAAQKMMALLAPITKIADANASSFLSKQMVNDYQGTATYGYNRNTSDTKINYVPNDNTQLFGRYSEVPYSLVDPQNLGAAGGGTFDGGQPGAASGVIRNVGLGMSHIFTPNLVLDADGGYTRQRTGAVDPLDQSVGTFGLTTLGIPGTNGAGANYAGMPGFFFTATSGGTPFTGIGNPSGANPFLFRDNQFTGDVNLVWTKGRHTTKYGFTYYHFDLNHFQPSGGGALLNPRGAFLFQGGMTANAASGYTSYNALADFLLGLPNNGTGSAVGKLLQLNNPNTLRWSQYGGYAQDQWVVNSKLTLNYGVRYDFFPMVYKDHEGVAILYPNLPQSANVELGGIAGNPTNAGVDVGKGMFEPRVGLVYRVSDKLVVRSGGGITEDPDSQRFMRDSYPSSQSAQYSGAGPASIALDSAGNPLTLKVGIPALTPANFSTGFASLPVGATTTTMPKSFHRGYIESWNLAIQDDLGKGIVANVAYVGTHQVRQLAGVSPLNASPLPDANSICMPNGQFNPNSGYATGPLGSNPCSFAANETINIGAPCPPGTTGKALGVCYNTAGITIVEPIFSSNYNGLQNQLTHNGKDASFGVVYTWSHAFDYEDNGAGSGAAGTAWNLPAYYKKNRATSGYDRTHNLQIWSIYHLPFGHGQAFANHGLASAILGGFQVNGQFSHTSGAPFSVSANNSNNAQGGQNYADLIAPYKQLGGHSRIPGNTAVSGGKPWFDPTVFANPVQPSYTATEAPSAMIAPHFGNTHRNQFRGPGQSMFNASAVRSIPFYHETKFEFRVEAQNLFNHTWVSNPNATVAAAGSTFGYITSFSSNGYQAATRFVQGSARFTF